MARQHTSAVASYVADESSFLKVMRVGETIPMHEHVMVRIITDIYFYRQ